MNALLLLDDGWSGGQVAQALYLDERTVAEYRAVYEAGGRGAVGALGYAGRKSDKLTAAQMAELKAHLRDRLHLTAAQACATVKTLFGVVYTTKAMVKVLKRLGFSYKKPKRLPAKVDPAAQAAFLKDILQPLINQASPLSLLCFMDAAHVLHNSEPAYGWILKGEDEYVKSNAGRSRISINGVFSLHDSAVIQRQDARINGVSNIALLQAVLDRYPEAQTIRVVMDNAPCNRSKEVKAFAAANPRLQIVYLPPYSPNLNLIERLWRFFRQNVLYNKFHPAFDDFKTAIAEFFNTLPNKKHALATLMTPKFQTFPQSA